MEILLHSFVSPAVSNWQRRMAKEWSANGLSHLGAEINSSEA